MASTDTGFGFIERLDDFDNVAVDATNQWMKIETGTGTQLINVAANGTCRITSHTDDNDLGGIATPLIFYAQNGGPLTMEVRFKPVTAITARAYFIGFSDDNSTAEIPAALSTATWTTAATDAVGFCYDTDATNDYWHCIGVKAGVDTTAINTGIAPVADTYATFRVVVDVDGYAVFSINGKEVGRIANTVTASVALCAGVWQKTNSDAAVICDVDYLYYKAGRS